MIGRIVVVGAGGLAREIKMLIRDLARSGGECEFRGYVVSDVSALSNHDSRDEVLGDLSWLHSYPGEFEAVAIGIGTPQVRLRISEEIRRTIPGVRFPALVHPRAHLDFESVRIAEGAVVCAGVLGTVNIVVEPFALCNLSCTVGHESVIGRGSVLNPGANISGGVTIGTGVLIGTGAQILQYRTVGDYATIGAGAVVTKDVESGATVVGIPARAVDKQGR